MPRGDKPYALKHASALARLRIDAGLTQAAAAERLDITPGALSNIERGTVPASSELLERMAEAYGATVLQVTRAYRAGRREQFTVREGL